MKTFKQPLTGEEELDHLERMRTGTEEEQIDSRNLLIEHNLRLVAHVVRRYRNCEEDPEDLISIGTVGLIKAIDTYSIEKGSRLATYAARCIDNELLMMLRARKKISREVSLYEPIGTDKEGNEISLLDITPDDQPDIAERLGRDEMLGMLAGIIQTLLNDREYEIICRRYGLQGYREQTQREIGIYMGISRSYVSRIEKRALTKLREALDQA